MLLFLFLILPNNAEAEAAGAAHIRLEGQVDPGQASFLSRALSEARAEGVEVVIIEIDSLGGFVDSALEMRDLLLREEMRTITFVDQRAWSAGALLAIAGDEFYMASGSSIGAAETRPQEEKYIAAFSREFAATAERQGRDPDLAAAMVDIDMAVEGAVDEGRLLSLTAGEAEALNFSDGSFADLDDLLAERGWSRTDLILLEKTFLETAAGFVTNPVVTVLLLSVGLVALVGEVLVPGFGLSGTVGVLSLGIFFSAYLSQGYAGLGLMALFLAGILLIVIEVFIIPGFGITGIGGLTAVLTSLFFIFPDRALALRIIVAVMVLSVLGVFLLIKIFGAAGLWKKISLESSETVEEGYISRAARKELEGKKGRAITPLRPSGTAEIEGRRVDVVTEGDYIEKETEIEILSSKGSRVVVKKLDDNKNKEE
ncbi:NfeD family protein [Halarsenatibacter silvermanii]|nr:NfeD family protein [Halarsenatibacter silvermanii]